MRGGKLGAAEASRLLELIIPASEGDSPRLRRLAQARAENAGMASTPCCQKQGGFPRTGRRDAPASSGVVRGGRRATLRRVGGSPCPTYVAAGSSAWKCSTPRGVTRSAGQLLLSPRPRRFSLTARWSLSPSPAPWMPRRPRRKWRCPGNGKGGRRRG